MLEKSCRNLERSEKYKAERKAERAKPHTLVRVIIEANQDHPAIAKTDTGKLVGLPREAAIIAAVACPVCMVETGQVCRQGISAHDTRRGAVDLRPILNRCHSERGAAWVARKGRP